jgi:hypothetical protein
MQQLPKSCELNLFLEFYYGTIMQDMCDPNAHFIFGSALVRLPNMENAHGQVLLGGGRGTWNGACPQAAAELPALALSRQLKYPSSSSKQHIPPNRIYQSHRSHTGGILVLDFNQMHMHASIKQTFSH